MAENLMNPDEAFEVEGHYIIADDGAAEWAIGKIREAEADIEKWTKFYDEQKRRIVEDRQNTIMNMKAMLQTYFEKVPHKVTKTQENYTLPSGKLVFKRQAPEFERDDAKIVDYLKATKQFQFITEGVKWGELKKGLTVVGETVADENGEIIEGIRAIERPDIFTVELKKEDKING